MLIEVMVAATLLAVGVTAAMQAIYRSLDASQESQMYTRALFLAQRAMSEVENEVNFNDLYDVANGWQDFEDSANYEWRASISEDDEFWVRRIIVSVRWAKNVNDLHNEEKNYYYRLVTEVPMPRYPEDYER
jgi:type II secretory pathway pseudopilin PulG